MSSYLTLVELAKHAGITPQSLRLHIRQGRLKAEKIPGARGWRVPHLAAERWMGRYMGKSLPSKP